mgnify:CR=1 FL=1
MIITTQVEQNAHHFTLSQDTLLNIRMQGNTQLQEVVIVSDKTETGTVATRWLYRNSDDTD